ncbi:hypothetical protein EHS25_004462 [Saitozyma podzolica]|uniref:Mitochondrial import inner membrane translocase subunit Tim21 n=1 Tax=Saitozyma podzolica TaxID=1890683 RepID=A0A427YU91_9TREE|nr:hypothetical protein EHS25_004462 [Saitozyma podzolica]
MPSRLRLVSFLLDTGPRSLSHGPIPLSLSARHLTTYPHPFVSTPTHLSGSSFRLAGLRCYATHKSTTPPGGRNSTDDLLRRLEDASRSKAARDAFDGRESVGPFPLGVGPSGRRKAWRRWRELGLGGKLVRTTQQTGNLTVILLGGGLFVILAFALTTELFAKNSPSVLYSQAVDMIRASDALNSHLLPPLTFTHTPHASAPVRGSPPLPHRLVRHPVSGRDHMLLTFWVHGRGRDEPEPLGWAKGLYRRAEAGLRGLGEWVGMIRPAAESDGDERLALAGERREVVGSPRRDGEQAHAQAQGQGMLGRMFGGITGRPTKEVRRGLPPPGTYKVGEVRADYVKNASGQFQLLSLVIDVPSSSVPHPGRAVVFWSPEADTEGLQGRIR